MEIQIIDAAKLNRIAFWRKVHRFVNIQATKIIQNGGEQFAAGCLFMGTLLLKTVLYPAKTEIH